MDMQCVLCEAGLSVLLLRLYRRTERLNVTAAFAGSDLFSVGLPVHPGRFKVRENTRILSLG
jgi:hypothetical protein